MTGGNLQPPSGGPMVWRHRRRWEPYCPITTNFSARANPKRDAAMLGQPNSKQLPPSSQLNAPIPSCCKAETPAKLQPPPRPRGKCPKDISLPPLAGEMPSGKGGRCRMIKPTTPRTRVLQRSLLWGDSCESKEGGHANQTARIEATPSNAAAPFRLPHLRFTIDNIGVNNSTLHTTQET